MQFLAIIGQITSSHPPPPRLGNPASAIELEIAQQKGWMRIVVLLLLWSNDRKYVLRNELQKHIITDQNCSRYQQINNMIIITRMPFSRRRTIHVTHRSQKHLQ